MLHVDKGYVYLRRRGIKARIARQRVESSERLGPTSLRDPSCVQLQ
jgi:hypothetical protein